MAGQASDADLKKYASALEELLKGTGSVTLKEPMAKHTTFRAGGAADLFVNTPASKVKEVLLFLREIKFPFFVLGNGSNVLVSDSGYHGAILHLTADDSKIAVHDGLLTCSAALRLGVVAHAAMEASLDGLVFATGIPGTIGGALTMNAGAYGGEMKDVVKSVKALDTEEGDIPEVILSREDMHFSYRHSIAKEKSLLFTEATLSLNPGSRDDIDTRMRDISKQRTEKQPLEYPSAGSTFKRPEGHFAGKLIMDAGLRGYSVGGAQVAEKHCGFVINRGGATATEIHTLMQDVQQKVLTHSGVKLEPEVILLGEFGKCKG